MPRLLKLPDEEPWIRDLMKTNTPSVEAGLVRALGPVMAMAVVVGTIIGSGIFKKPASIAKELPAPGLVALVWVTGGVLVLLGALAYAEVGILLPKAGGNYVFLREGYGRLFGFLWGWVDFLIIRTASLAALATIFTESLHDLAGRSLLVDLLEHPADGVMVFWAQRLLTVAVLLGLAWVNVRGVRWGGGVQVLITAVKVGSLLAIVILPFAIYFLHGTGTGWRTPTADNLRPFWPDDWSQVTWGGLGTAFLGVLWAYHGWQNIAPVAGEVARPQRNIPLALLGGVLVVIALYLGANLAYYMVLPRAELAQLKDTTVVAQFGRVLLGPVGAALAATAVMISVFGALNGNVLVGPRLLYAMGEDGLVPRFLGAVHPRFHTPAPAIWVMAGWSCLLILSVAVLTQIGLLDPKKTSFDMLTDFAMFGAIIFETMAVMVIFVLRSTMPDAPRPYRCWGYPVVPLLYVILPAFILGNMFVYQRLEAGVGAGLIALGGLVYFGLGLQRTRDEDNNLRPSPLAPGPSGH